MKARVFVTLKPSVFDPQGRTIVDALQSLGYGAVADVRQGKYFELDLSVPVARRGREARGGSRRPRARESGHRELPHRARRRRASHDVRRRRLSRIELRSRRLSRGEARARPAGAVRLAQGDARSAAPTSSSCPAASRTATTCAPAPSRGSRRSWRRSREFAAKGGPVLGICNGFQILLECGLLPGAMLRNRDLKFHCEFVGVRVERTDTPFTQRCTDGPGAAAFRSRTARATTTRRPTCCDELQSSEPGRLPLRRCARRGDGAGQSERLARQHRRHLQRSAQRRRPDAASGARLRAGARQRGRACCCSSRWSTRCPNEDRSRMPFDAATLERHGITPDEYDRIVELVGREPNLTELGLFSVMWSEHCSYKSSRVHLKTLPTEGPRVVQGPGENAGAVDIGDGLAAVFKIESHNHPSFIEPYQGAATGVGGIIRDIFTMGARPIALLDALRFGSIEEPRTPPDPARRRRRHRRLRQQHRHSDHRRRGDVRRDLQRQSARQRLLPRHREARRARQGHRRAASAIPSTTSAPRPAATASTARRWRRRSSTTSRRRSARRCRSAIRSWRSCCSKRASRSWRPTPASACRTWARRD